MFDFKKIIKKIEVILQKELNKKITYKDIAKALDTDYNYFKQRVHKNRIPFAEIIMFCGVRKISINWLFLDQLPEMLLESTNNIIMLKYNNILGSTGKGIENYQLDTINNIAFDTILLNFFNANYKYTEIIQSFGDSMEPLIPDNSIVFIDKSKTEILNNKVYAILKEEQLFIKTISKEKDKYIAKNINKEYEDFILDNFKIIGRVVGVMHKI